MTLKETETECKMFGYEEKEIEEGCVLL